MTATVRDARGAVIICDHISLLEGRKPLLVGCYTQVSCPEREWRMGGLCIYVRFQCDQVDPLLEILLIDRAEPPTHDALMRMEFPIVGNCTIIPAEVLARTPPFAITCPQWPLAPGTSCVLSYTLWAQVNGIPLASSPLIVNFRPPTTELHHEQPPSDGAS
jgi:hypothetical protein